MGISLHDPQPQGNLRLRLMVAGIFLLLVLLLTLTHRGPTGDIPERIPTTGGSYVPSE